MALLRQRLCQFDRVKMTKDRPELKQTENVLTRYGKQIYRTNPSLDGSIPIRTKSSRSTLVGNAHKIATETGEIVSNGAINFIEEIEVDEEQFVKVYLDGIRQHTQLGKAGIMLFEFVYRVMSGANSKDKDTVDLNYLIAKDWKPDLARRTYDRGIAELLDKEFLFRSITADVYFVNIRFMFNGKRQNLIKSYYKKEHLNQKGKRIINEK